MDHVFQILRDKIKIWVQIEGDECVGWPELGQVLSFFNNELQGYLLRVSVGEVIIELCVKWSPRRKATRAD